MDLFETIIDTLPKGDANNLPLSKLPSEEQLAQVFLDCCNDLPGAVTVRCSYETYQKMVRLDRKNSQRRRTDETGKQAVSKHKSILNHLQPSQKFLEVLLNLGLEVSEVRLYAI
jgi:hypothetical protein